MNQEEYFKLRVDDQIDWYDKKSVTSQKLFKRLRLIELVCAAFIPLLAGYATQAKSIQYTIGAMGLIVAIITGIIGLFRFQENWVEYRTTCESLKHEKYLFLTKCKPYDSADAFQFFVNQVERLISSENSKWSQHISANREKNKPGDK